MFRTRAKAIHSLFNSRWREVSVGCRQFHQSNTHQNKQNSSNNDGNNHKSFSSVCLVAAAPTFLAFFKKKETEDDELTFLEKLIPEEIRILLQKEDESPEGRLVMTLKRSIYMMQLNKMEKAEQMIHLALRMAQDMKHTTGITLCYDIMANLAMEREQYEKAEKLFVVVIQRLLQAGDEQDDIKVLHISLKIAQIAEYTGSYEKAEQGYNWVLDNLQRKYQLNRKDKDIYELIGLTCLQ